MSELDYRHKKVNVQVASETLKKISEKLEIDGKYPVGHAKAKI